ncbi:decapping and exoribonuclease protein-like [Lycorma delicatula]|uniref:decapping and exoribonuclease protein-like n=1 Tax=Lycorma delicatula TaxID=130591 RepID=UPI003F519784
MGSSSRFEMQIFNENDKASTLNCSMPKIIGYFSVNGNKEYRSDGSQLKYIYYLSKKDEEKVSFNLNHMSDLTVKKDDTNKTWNKLDHMFKWIGLNSSRLLPIDDLLFLTYRGNLTTVMCSPYENNDDWTICARMCDGIVYLNSFETDNDILKSANVSDFQKKCMSWGFKFEQFVLTDDPTKKPDTNLVLNENEELCCVFERRIGGHRIVYGAEMDGVVSDKILSVDGLEESLSKVQFIELKTSRIIERFNQDRNFRRYKMLKWWSQSYLVGIKTIICGFRDDNGIVKILKRYDVDELPKLASGLWDKNVCLNFLNRFLHFVRQVILENDSTITDVWKFDFFPRHQIHASKITENDSNKYTYGFEEIKISKVQG